MAEFGCKMPCFLADGQNAGINFGRLVSANLTLTMATGELYADDALDEGVTEFISGSIAMETNDITDEHAAIIYGCTVESGEVTYNTEDAAPAGVLGYYKCLMRNKKKYFKAIVYPCVKAAIGNDNAQTKGSSITFATVSTTFTVMSDGNGVWRKTKTFESEADAIAYIKNACRIAGAAA